MSLVALSVIVLAGCGDGPGTTGTSARTVTSVAQAPAATATTSTGPVTPRASASGITVARESGANDRFRSGGRSWRGCGTTINNNNNGYDLYAVAVSGQVGCAAGTAVIRALSLQVQRREAAGEDCFPGYCHADGTRPTTVKGYRCSSTDHGDVSISLSIVCRQGDRYVSAGAADDE